MDGGVAFSRVASTVARLGESSERVAAELALRRLSTEVPLLRKKLADAAWVIESDTRRTYEARLGERLKPIRDSYDGQCAALEREWVPREIAPREPRRIDADHVWLDLIGRWAGLLIGFIACNAQLPRYPTETSASDAVLAVTWVLVGFIGGRVLAAIVGTSVDAFQKSRYRQAVAAAQDAERQHSVLVAALHTEWEAKAEAERAAIYQDYEEATTQAKRVLDPIRKDVEEKELQLARARQLVDSY